jgi:hypothetical protein
MNGVVCMYCCGDGGVEYAYGRLQEDVGEIDMHNAHWAASLL